MAAWKPALVIKGWNQHLINHMAHQPHLNSLQSPYDFSSKSPCPSSTSMKIKTLVHAHIFPHVSQLVQALTKAKNLVVELLKKKSLKKADYKIDICWRKKEKKSFLSFIRVCCNLSSSHILPMPDLPSRRGFDVSHAYYDSTWNSIIATGDADDGVEPQLSGYLHWLEEKVPENSVADDDTDEINRLAEKFIASCHEKFRLEKQESYRRYHEMLARSI